MLNYMVASSKYRVIDGLGVFNADEVKMLDAEAGESFKRIRGVSLLQDNLPEDVELTIVVMKEN